MNLRELAFVLEELGVRSDAYSLDGGLPSETYCLDQVNGRWEIYYSERGQKSGQQVFNSEDEACRMFLELMGQDELVKSYPE